jgi:hypothetical protein
MYKVVFTQRNGLSALRISSQIGSANAMCLGNELGEILLLDQWGGAFPCLK